MTLSITKNTKYILAALVAVAMLLLSPVAFAHEGNDNRGDTKRGEDRGLHLGGLIKAKLDVNHDGTVSKEEREDKMAQWRDEWRNRVTAGIVTSVNGSVFTIDPFGGKSTTTVTTNADTKIKGEASLADLDVGSKVLVMGTTTATSSTGDSFTASVVKVLGNSWGKIKFWFGVR